MPSALLARRLRSRLGCQKQVVAGDRGRSRNNMSRAFLFAFVLLAFCGCDSQKNSTLEISKTAVTLGYTVHGINSYRACGLLKNLSHETLAFPVLKVELPNVSGSLMHTVTSCIIPPGESRYFLTGGKGIEAFEPPLKVKYLYSDTRIDKNYVARQLEYLPKLRCTVVSFDSFDNGEGGDLRYHFVNNSGLQIGSIQATAVFFDANDNLIAARGFHSTQLGEPDGKHIVMDIENGLKVARTEIQINSFLETGATQNPRVAVPPSIE